MTRALRIGLTGGIASGKSTVADMFRKLGVPVIDADEAARAVVEPGKPGLAQVVERFGPEILSADGTLDRRALRKLIFDDARARRDLEAILHPLIRAQMDHWSADAPGPYQIFAIPLLIEAGKTDRLDHIDRILVIDADESTQLQRLMARDASSRDEALAIMASQASRSDRLEAADDVLENDASVSELRQVVEKLHARYLGLAAAMREP